MSERKWGREKWVILSVAPVAVALLLIISGLGKERVSESGSQFSPADFASLKPGDRLIDNKGREWTVKSPLYVIDWSSYGAKPRLEEYFDVVAVGGHEVRVQVPDLIRSTKQIIRQ